MVEVAHNQRGVLCCEPHWEKVRVVVSHVCRVEVVWRLCACSVERVHIGRGLPLHAGPQIRGGHALPLLRVGLEILQGRLPVA